MYLYFISDWTAVTDVINTKMYWHLERTPLQIKTDSTLSSKDKIVVLLYDFKDKVGSFEVNFGKPNAPNFTFLLTPCTDWANLLVEPPAEVDKTWTFTKTDTAFIITCNGVEVLNYLFADSSDSDCVPTLGGNVVESINIYKFDKASDFYKTGKGLHGSTYLIVQNGGLVNSVY